MATMAEVAVHLDLGEEFVRKLKLQGVFSAAARGQMDLDACRVSYIRHLRERAAGRASDEADAEGLDLVEQRARLASEQADHYAMRNAQVRRELAPVADVTSAVIGLIETAKGRLARVPAKVAKANSRLKGEIADAIEDALEDLSLTRVEEQAGSDGRGEEPDDD